MDQCDEADRLSGMTVARAENMDPGGIFTIGLVTALDGGTLRDLMMDNHRFTGLNTRSRPYG
ncbi:TRIC cation channel family protein [Marinobacter orientalis]|uniref:TRIC cation channel family protein n=1 Tax=Marinobacter orientalis TaxID=1928859 RepID=UPI001D194783|nr:TRIC cation channel family protein [Marinobacter orientalis]